jgi:PEP-CTERM motif
MYGKLKLALFCVAVVLLFGVNAPAEVFSENFDSYAAGSQMHGQGGWKGWDNSLAAGALVSNAFAVSSPNSVAIAGDSDLVHEWTGLTTGRYEVSAMQYIPSGATATTYFILLNIYNDGGPYNWSVQATFNLDTDTLTDDFAPDPKPTLPIVRDQWVKIAADIDLDADTVNFYYNNTLLSTHAWKTGGESVSEIKAIDLYAGNSPATMAYYDDVVIQAIPEPSVLCLLGTGLLALGLVLRWRRK